jgi:uncharacterized protein (TIGR02231 family)
MTNSTLALALSASLAAIAGLTVTSADAAEVKATSTVDAVTVYPSGAEVARLARVKLDRGEHVILLEDLPAQAVGQSIRVEGRATGRLDIGSVDTRRVSVARTDPAVASGERRRLEDEIEKARDERIRLTGEIATAEQQQALIRNLTTLPTRPVPPGGQAGPAEDWPRLIALIGSASAEAVRAIQAAQIKVRETDRRIQDLEKALASLAPAREERTEVKVHVVAGAPIEADLVVRYQVPGASWTPYYDARLSTGTKVAAPKLTLVRRAAITQRTGEAWENVTLTLSTARPAAGTAAPVLGSWTIDFLEPRPVPVAAAPVPAAPPAGRANLPRSAMSEDSAGLTAREKVQRAEEVRAEVVAAPFQTQFIVPGRGSVPATGEAKRVQIEETFLEPQLLARTVPRRDAKAYLYAKMTLPRGTPFLPGQVSLFRDTIFVGQGRLPLLAPGEDHELAFGVDDNVRVRHAIAEEKRGETGLISTSKTDQRSFRITVKSLHERPILVSVLDQIPVAQNQDIRVEVTSKPQPSRRDIDEKKGVLAWDDTLKPDEERVIELGYRITWPSGKQIVDTGR